MDIVELEDNFFKNTQDYSALTGNEKPEILGGQVGGTYTQGQSETAQSTGGIGREPLTYNNWYQIYVQKYPISNNKEELIF
jgi:hypothetical protein